MERKVEMEVEDRTGYGKSRAEVMEELLQKEFIPFFKRMAEIQAIENALKDARIAGDKALHEGLAKVLMEKLSR